MRPSSETVGDGSSGDIPCVLIVDDDTAFATTLGLALRRRGINTETANNPVTGLKLAKELRPAVILVDVLMPGMDGIEFARALRDNAHASRLVLMSGDLDAMRAANEEFAGAYAVIDKPMPVPALVQFLRNVLER